MTAYSETETLLCHCGWGSQWSGVEQGLEVKAWILEVASHVDTEHSCETMDPVSRGPSCERQPQLAKRNPLPLTPVARPFVTRHVKGSDKGSCESPGVDMWGWVEQDHTLWLTSASLVFCPPSLGHLWPQQILPFLLTCQTMLFIPSKCRSHWKEKGAIKPSGVLWPQQQALGLGSFFLDLFPPLATLQLHSHTSH